LISFPTISQYSNLDLIYYIEEYLQKYNITSTLQFNEDKTKANLIATLGPSHIPGLILAAHTDVVPIENQNWRADPFTPWVIDERLYGRGAADMKGFIAVILSLIPTWSSFEFHTPLHIVFTYDEEVGCLGAYKVINFFPQQNIAKPLACLIGEPTEMEVINAHKSIKLLRTITRGSTGHSSRPLNMGNSLTTMCDLVLFLHQLSKSYQKNMVNTKNDRFECPYTTLNVGYLKSGNAINVIPAESEILWEYRTIPNENENEILERFLDYCKEKYSEVISITTEELASVPSLSPDANETFTKKLLHLNSSLKAKHVDYCTEAGIYQRLLGVPTIVCGPGSIKQAHKEDEYVELNQLAKAHSLLIKITKEICYNARKTF